MRRRAPAASRVLMALALLLGASATLVLQGYLSRLEAQARAAGPGVPVVVAARGLARGTVLDASSVRVGSMPERFLPPGALRTVEQAVGRLLSAEVAPGEVLTAARLAPPGGPVASLVPPGLRAVPVTAAIPSTAVLPGDRVDVLATFGPGAASGGPHAETVASEAEVLLVVERAGFEEPAGATTVVLLVTPETAERLAYARALADLSLAIAPPASVVPPPSAVVPPASAGP
ncbi:MAG: Flp pilus assembly protein CpaB [Actinomycetota bacterium]